MSNITNHPTPTVVRCADAHPASTSHIDVADAAAAPTESRHRLMVIDRPGLMSECLCRMLTECGFDIALQPITDPVRDMPVLPELSILCISQLDHALLTTARRRIEELHGLAPGVPVLALVEEAPSPDRPDLSQLGIAATVVGLPSLRIAVAAIQFVLAAGPLVAVDIRLALGPANGSGGLRTSTGHEGEGDDAAELQGGRFTRREVAVLQRLRQGQPNKIIAHALGISESTVKVHLRSIMAKLKATNRTQIVCMLGAQQEDPAAQSTLSDA